MGHFGCILCCVRIWLNRKIGTGHCAAFTLEVNIHKSSLSFQPQNYVHRASSFSGVVLKRRRKKLARCRSYSSQINFQGFTMIFYPVALAISSGFLGATIIVYIRRSFVFPFGYVLYYLLSFAGQISTVPPLERSPLAS